jgi:hypothetical protein
MRAMGSAALLRSPLIPPVYGSTKTTTKAFSRRSEAMAARSGSLGVRIACTVSLG